MKWLDDFQLFLFDFDGLLVNTEHLHYQAYLDTLSKWGYRLDWSFEKFCSLAHLNATALKQAIYEQHPSLDPNWDRIYADKKKNYLELLKQGNVALMPGVEKVLKYLEEKQIRRCVVTNSPLEQIQQIRSLLPILQSIPYWVTREQYSQPKPNPECYEKAIQLYGMPKDRIIGFEDSIRGLQALRPTPATAVLICSSQHPLLQGGLEPDCYHYGSFDHIDKLPS
jgi:beta-phosphoglucomutase